MHKSDRCASSGLYLQSSWHKCRLHGPVLALISLSHFMAECRKRRIVLLYFAFVFLSCIWFVYLSLRFCLFSQVIGCEDCL